MIQGKSFKRINDATGKPALFKSLIIVSNGQAECLTEVIIAMAL